MKMFKRANLAAQAFKESPPSFTFLASLSFSPASAFLLMAMLATGFGLPLDPEAPSEEPPAEQTTNEQEK